jgi:hypothetical protein
LWDKEVRPTRRETDDKGLHAKGGNIEKTREPTPREGGQELGLDGHRPAGPGRSAQPSPGPNAPSFDLAAIRAIYSPGVESHASSNSSSAAEEQRREGHHPGEEMVELVD